MSEKQLISAGEVRSHFDSIAEQYDNLKEKNWYYYESLKRTLLEVVPPASNILDVGTGTGQILASLAPAKGLGIDLSPNMIAIAKQRFPHLEFDSFSYENLEPGNWDFILLIDVIEHLSDVRGFFSHMRRIACPATRLVVTMANPLWEPVLEFLAKLGLKMDEGPHYRITRRQLLTIARDQGFDLESQKNSTLLPVFVPVLSQLLNKGVAHLPLVNRLALIQRYVFRRVI